MEFFRRFKSSYPLPRPRLRLQVLSAEEILPWPLQLVHPGGLWNALLGVPSLGKRSTPSVMALERPMRAGHYFFQGLPGTIAAVVERCEEDYSYPGRKPDLAGCEYEGLGVVERDRAERAQWVVTLDLLKITGELEEAVGYQMALADRLATLTRGLVLDEECRRYYLPEKWRVAGAVVPLDVREHVVTRLVKGDNGTLWVHTHGMSKFGQPELEIVDLPSPLADAACWLLTGLSQRMVDGSVLRPGGAVGDPGAPLLLRPSLSDPMRHFGGPVLELVDVDRGGRPVERGAIRGIEAYRTSLGEACSSAGL